MTGQATIIDFLENALEGSAEELLVLAEERPGVLLARRDAFWGTWETSWRPLALSELPRAASDELRPMYARGLLSTSGVLSSYYVDDTAHAAAAREVKALLLYAHGTVVVNPLSPWFSVGDAGPVAEGRPDGMSFVRALQSLLELAELVRAGTVQVVEPPPVTWRSDVDLEAALRAHGGSTMLAAAGWDQWEAHGRTKDALARLLALALLDPEDRAGALAVRAEEQDTVLVDLVRHVATHLDPGLALPAEQARLTALMRLSLPGVDGLRPADMTLVREDDHFIRFRNDMRLALAAADDALAGGDLTTARNDVVEHMTARAAELRGAKVTTRFWGATSSALVGWGVGAAVGGLAGWKAALLGLLTRGIYDTAQSRPSRGEAALLQHYVALSEPQAPLPLSSGAARIRAWRESG